MVESFFWGMRENGGGFFGVCECVFPAADKKITGENQSVRRHDEKKLKKMLYFLKTLRY